MTGIKSLPNSGSPGCVVGWMQSTKPNALKHPSIRWFENIARPITSGD